ncbi:MAG: hypothetical protein Q8Q81_00535 [Oxalobacteraceae bacterium]|nr:hypothetical protein [Oxalobacteraceae bacterium]
MNTLQKLMFQFRAARINRRIDALLHRASRPYTPSAHLVGHVPAQPAVQDVPDHSKSAWFPLALLAVAFCAGYVVADDKRIDDLAALRSAVACNGARLAAADTPSDRKQ